MSDVIYTSVFKNEFEDLINLKKSLGFKYESMELSFARIDKFLVENNVESQIITKDIADKFCTKRSYESQSNLNHRISDFRIFTTYLDELGFNVYVPPKGLTRKGPKYNAHIYTDDELQRFFKVVDQSQSLENECPYRALVMPIFFRILYTTGMRLSELRLAKIKDVNLEDGYIKVTNGKNKKERLVPINDELLVRCREFKEKVHSSSPDDEYFFLIRRNTPMTLQNVYRNFRRYLEKAGISHTGKGPRIHDFRHTFCVNLLRKWVDEGKDLLVYLPYMRTILGHETFEETAYYVKLTSERFPYIKEAINKAFPNIIMEVNLNDEEFY